MIGASALAALAFLAAPLAAQTLSLSPPVACRLGQDCFILQYVDQDPGRGARDYLCGPLSYDKHTGTDFALPTLRDMERGVSVIAAAPGVVTRIRDGRPDQLYTSETARTTAGRECGNGVRIDHGGGWETQYCHLKRQSVSVREGQSVRRGERLGQIGLSGRTQFPHVHMTLFKDGDVVDPFRPQSTASCQRQTGKTLWQTNIAYQAGGLLDVGFATRIPAYKDVVAGRAARPRIRADAPALVIFGYAFGAEAGDEMRFDIAGPSGYRFQHSALLEARKAQLFQAAGQRRGDSRWQPGRYKGTVVLVRNGRRIGRQSVTTTIR